MRCGKSCAGCLLYTSYIEEMIEGQKVIKVFNHEEKAKEGFYGINETYRKSSTAAQTFAGAMMPAMGNISHINYALTCCIGGLFAINGMFYIDTLVAFLQYVRQISQPVSMIAQQVNTVLAAVAGAERVFEVMEETPECDAGKVVLVNVTGDQDVYKRQPYSWILEPARMCSLLLSNQRFNVSMAEALPRLGQR